ncbi:hypothetical protein Bpfe_009231 [Biomphalaria pfeifferi]|uniref:Uncharacterized protein n=1 Tax=Biomphalaria pfeifferi TaxID=112525 RepID=A0AAD8BX35_BIOPF|nr:hypothetical protein Bpfe_009231 [Biomphalaria pfeifferi]
MAALTMTSEEPTPQVPVTTHENYRRSACAELKLMGTYFGQCTSTTGDFLSTIILSLSQVREYAGEGGGHEGASQSRQTETDPFPAPFFREPRPVISYV